MSSREYRRLRWKLLRIEVRRKILTKIRELHREWHQAWQRNLQKVESHREEQLEFRL